MWVDGPKRTPEQVNPSVRRRVHDMQYHAFTVPIPEAAEELALQPPAITRLQEVSVPALIIVGDYDIPDKLALAQKPADEILRAQQVVIPVLAHMVPMQQPHNFNRVVL